MGYFYRINIGLSVVAAGFGDIRRGLKLWAYDFCVTMSFYPLLVVYGWIGALSRKYPGKRSLSHFHDYNTPYKNALSPTCIN